MTKTTLHSWLRETQVWMDGCMDRLWMGGQRDRIVGWRDGWINSFMERRMDGPPMKEKALQTYWH